VLLGIVLSQLVREGTPVGVPGWSGGPYNLKTLVGNYVLADEQGVATEMGKYYGLPVFGLAGSTDSKILDQQCGFEACISLTTALLHGANIVHDLGFMDSGLQASLQLMTICDDFIGFLRACTAGVVVNDETLALDVIDELGPNGNYLAHDHTMRHFREPYYSEFADKGVYSLWEENGAKSTEQKAADKIDAILQSHEPEPLPADVQRGIKEIVRREQAWADGRK
jgi:trimethylamine--corrinoid protein Co-methyltransferase